MSTLETLAYWLHKLAMLLPWVVVMLGGVVFIIVAMTAILNLLEFYRLLRQKEVFLELTPPAKTDKAAEATQRLFSVLHGLEASRSLRDKLLRHKVTFSLEVVSTKSRGIRYILRVAESDADNFERTIVAYVPSLRIQRVEDFIPRTLDYRRKRIIEVKQAGYFAYPLNNQGLLAEHDPMAYLTGAMTKLSDSELLSLQIVVSPVKIREADTLAGRILHNEELLHQLGKYRPLVIGIVFSFINLLLFGVIDGISDVCYGSSNTRQDPRETNVSHKQQVALNIKPARSLSAFEQKLAESVHNKVSQPLFRANIRALVIVSSHEEEKQRVKGLRDWLALFSVPKYQSLRVRYSYPFWLHSRYRLFALKNRLPSLFVRNTCIFSSAELADLYHFPHTQTGKTENVVKSLSKTLPAPISLKSDQKLDVLLGENRHHGSITPIGLTEAERERHVYIIGGTGNGKTTMLLYSIVQDIKNGKGVAILDPHGDLAETILRHVPDDRIKDVIYLNPDDLSHPIGVNLLELPEGLSGDELLREKDLVTESTISVLRKIFSEDDSGGHRIEYVLRNAIQTALTLEGSTLFTIFRLLNDTGYRKGVVNKLDDPDLVNFWKNELGKAGDFQKVKMSAGITAKIGRFLFSASAKKILEQPKSTINFEDILNEKKILICNFSKGLLGEDTSTLFGTTVLAKLQVASLRRARQKQADRTPYYLYVDEFQNFATMSFVQLLSEARKYKLFLTMAEQSTSQQDEQRLVDIILANVGTVICFRSGSPADERLILPLFSPYIEQGEIANLPSYNFYARIAAIRSQEPMSGVTVLLSDTGSEVQAEAAISYSRDKYSRIIEKHTENVTETKTILKNLRKTKPRVNQETLKVS